MTTILNQHLTKRDIDYLDSEDQDTVMVVRDRKMGVITTSKLVTSLITLYPNFYHPVLSKKGKTFIITRGANGIFSSSLNNFFSSQNFKKITI